MADSIRRRLKDLLYDPQKMEKFPEIYIELNGGSLLGLDELDWIPLFNQTREGIANLKFHEIRGYLMQLLYTQISLSRHVDGESVI